MDDPSFDAAIQLAIDHGMATCAALAGIGAWGAVDDVNTRAGHTMTALRSGAEHELDFYSSPMLPSVPQ